MIPNTNLTMPSSTASTVCHQYTAVSKAAIGTTIRDLFFKILANFSKTAWTPRVASCSHYDWLYGCGFRFT